MCRPEPPQPITRTIRRPIVSRRPFAPVTSPASVRLAPLAAPVFGDREASFRAQHEGKWTTRPETSFCCSSRACGDGIAWIRAARVLVSRSEERGRSRENDRVTGESSLPGEFTADRGHPRLDQKRCRLLLLLLRLRLFWGVESWTPGVWNTRFRETFTILLPVSSGVLRRTLSCRCRNRSGFQITFK